jgi:hypothetical protein
MPQPRAPSRAPTLQKDAEIERREAARAGTDVAAFAGRVSKKAGRTRTLACDAASEKQRFKSDPISFKGEPENQ